LITRKPHTVEVIVPNTDESEDNGQVVLQLGLGKVLVHGVGTVEHLLEVFVTNRQTDGETDSGPERVSTSDPVPKGKHVSFGDTEFGDGVSVGGKGNEVLGNVCGLNVSFTNNDTTGNRRLTSLAVSRNQSFALVAFVMVSWVVKVFEATMKTVVSLSQDFKTSARSVPSMLETKCIFKSLLE